MHDEFKAWLRNDWLNIALTIFCAIIPLIPEIFWYVQGEAQSSETSIKDSLENKFFYISLCQFLIALIGLFIVSLRYKPTAILDVSNQRSLQDYIEDVCNIKQTNKNDSNTAYHVVKSIVRQFYNAWIIIWVIWLAYFGVDMICHSLPEIRCSHWLRMNLSGILSLFDFLGSSALLGVYIILNHVTVDIARRTDKHYSYVYWSVIIVTLLFVLGAVLQVLNLFAPSPDRVVYQQYISLLLSAFGAFSFVLVLGTLNSNYLNIPPVFIILLYIYAIAQAFSFLYTEEKSTQYGLYNHLVDWINYILPWIITIGKIILLMTLSWILDKKRLIFYIVHRSLSITQMKGQLKEFNRYLN